MMRAGLCRSDLPCARLLLFRNLLANSHLPAASQGAQEVCGLKFVRHCKADAVVAKINEHFVPLSLNAVNGRREQDVLSVTQQRPDGALPLSRELGEQFGAALR